MPGKPDMSLGILLNVTATQNQDNTFNKSATYAQGQGTAPPSQGVVDSAGNIDLTKFQDPNNAYDKATDIQIWINSTNVTDKNGNPLILRFPDPRSQAITFSGPDIGTEFVRLAGLGSQFALAFTDLDTEVGQYSYCLTVNAYNPALPHDAGFNIPLDPTIVNRPQ